MSNPAPYAHPEVRSACGMVRPDGLRITLQSTRLASLVTPEMIAADYDAGRIGCGKFSLAPDPYELIQVSISHGPTL